MLGKQQEALFGFLDTISEVLAESHHLHQLPNLREKVNFSLALLERNLPISIQVCNNN